MMIYVNSLHQAPFAGNKKKTQIPEPRNQGSSYNHPDGCDPKEKHCCIPQIAASLHHPDAKHHRRITLGTVAPARKPSQKETNLPTIHLQVRTVSFREGTGQCKEGSRHKLNKFLKSVGFQLHFGIAGRCRLFQLRPGRQKVSSQTHCCLQDTAKSLASAAFLHQEGNRSVRTVHGPFIFTFFTTLP